MLKAKRPGPVAVLFVASILWGLTWMPLKYFEANHIAGPWLLFVTQGLLALVMLYPGFHARTIARHWRSLGAITLFGGGAILCFTLALMYGEVIRVMVLFYLLPVWGVLGGKLFLHERVDAVRWLGVVAAVAGAVLILGGPAILQSPPNWLDLLALLSGLFFAINNLYFRAVVAVPVSTKLLAMFVGCSVLAGMIILAGVQASIPDASPLNWGLLVVYGLTWLLAANLGSQWAVTRMETGRSSIIIIMELVAAVISALILAGERLSALEWLGCVLVVIAAYLEASRQQDDALPQSA